MISPTVGRVVNFVPARESRVANWPGQPNVALIAYVWNDRMVNLACFDANGVHYAETSVRLLQDDDHRPWDGRYAYWMDYQKWQAAKYDALAASKAEDTKSTSATYSETAIEAEIIAKGKTAPRITPADIDAQIVSESFYVFAGTTLTICALTLRNGFHVTGESAAASPENFDQQIVRKIARENARAKIWALEGYALRSRLSLA